MVKVDETAVVKVSVEMAGGPKFRFTKTTRPRGPTKALPPRGPLKAKPPRGPTAKPLALPAKRMATKSATTKAVATKSATTKAVTTKSATTEPVASFSQRNRACHRH